jgi:hypothetical protein
MCCSTSQGPPKFGTPSEMWPQHCLSNLQWYFHCVCGRTVSAYDVDTNARTVKGVPNITVPDMTVIGCTLSSIINQTAVVDSKTKKLISAHPVATKTESEWLPWNPQVANIDPQIDRVSSAKAIFHLGLVSQMQRQVELDVCWDDRRTSTIGCSMH